MGYISLGNYFINFRTSIRIFESTSLEKKDKLIDSKNSN